MPTNNTAAHISRRNPHRKPIFIVILSLQDILGHAFGHIEIMSQAQSVIDSIAQYFDSADYSDLTITCCGRSWKVHRVIICSQSKVLRAALITGFKEACTGVIDLEDDDVVPVEIMLNYFYTGEYEEPINENEELRLRLQVHVLTYNLADKYDVPALMELAKERFKSSLSKPPTPEEFLFVIPDVYTIPIPTNSLRAIAVEYARRKLRDMMQGAEDLEILRATLRDVPEFTFDVLQLFVNEPLRGYCQHCCRAM